eukprot:CAMPEP_0176472978 /NCGR_PEP_ID=MMETSP0127-20121128/42047_1 /TAXON_ID=938130 /ORGANISM="Platyophrya macrostoma, Strain WH" /LENGTH=386 /DNA_ID=CAMNT_0017867915 /DNA_START=1 /DNA_END=1162 /DNA_ORIENTATION=-
MLSSTYFAAKRAGMMRRRASVPPDGEGDQTSLHHNNNNDDSNVEDAVEYDDDADDTTTSAVEDGGNPGEQHKQHAVHSQRSCCYGANLGMLGAIEELVEMGEGGRTSPRNADEDVELVTLSRSLSRGNSMRAQKTGNPTPPPTKLASAKGTLVIAVPKSPQMPSGITSAMLVPNTSSPGSAGAAPEHVDPGSAGAAPHPHTVIVDFATDAVGHHVSFAAETALTGGRHHGFSSLNGSGTRSSNNGGAAASPVAVVPMPTLTAYDDDLDASALDSGRFTLSFPNQLSFGLDVVRNLIKSTTSVSDGDRASAQQRLNVARKKDVAEPRHQRQHRCFLAQVQAFDDTSPGNRDVRILCKCSIPPKKTPHDKEEANNTTDRKVNNLNTHV